MLECSIAPVSFCKLGLSGQPKAGFEWLLVCLGHTPDSIVKLCLAVQLHFWLAEFYWLVARSLHPTSRSPSSVSGTHFPDSTWRSILLGSCSILLDSAIASCSSVIPKVSFYASTASRRLASGNCGEPRRFVCPLTEQVSSCFYRRFVFSPSLSNKDRVRASQSRRTGHCFVARTGAY